MNRSKNKRFFKRNSLEKKECFIHKIKDYAVIITTLSLIFSIYQFRCNSENTRKSFIKQMTINDSLITQLKKISALTDTQIQIVSKQLADQIQSGNPIMYLDNLSISDTSSRFYDMYAPIIQCIFKNSGKRTAYNITNRFFIVKLTDSVPFAKFQDHDSSYLMCEQNNCIYSIYKPKLPFRQLYPFYFVTELKYLDKYTNKSFYNLNISYFDLDRSNLDHFACSYKESMQVVTYVNECIDDLNSTSLKKIEHVNLNYYQGDDR